MLIILKYLGNTGTKCSTKNVFPLNIFIGTVFFRQEIMLKILTKIGKKLFAFDTVTPPVGGQQNVKTVLFNLLVKKSFF